MKEWQYDIKRIADSLEQIVYLLSKKNNIEIPKRYK